MKQKHWLWIIIGVLALAISTAALSRSSSYKSTSFKSSGKSSYKFSSNTSPSKPPVTYSKPKPVAKVSNNVNSNSYKATNTPPKPANIAPVQKSTFGTSNAPKTDQIAKAQKVAQSKSTYTDQRKQFKPRPVVNPSTAATGTTTRATSTTPTYTSRIVIKSSNYNQSTYYKRRSGWYNDWDAPSYSYNSYSSFGAWDSMALWFMLSQASTNAMYASMFYHQANDPGIQEWRREAERLAQSDAALRAQLAALDSSMVHMKASNVSVNPDFTPTGVDADVLLTKEAIKANAPELRLCTGNPTKTYDAIGRFLQGNLETVNAKNINTIGSIENLQKMDKEECDAAFVQRDTYVTHANDTNGATKLDYTRVLAPYSEVVHLICTRDSGILNLSQMKNNDKLRIVTGSKGSGSNVTWSNLVNSSADYAPVSVMELDGVAAEQALFTNKADCMLNVSGVGNQFMKLINERDKYELVEWDEIALNDVLDPALDKVYTPYTLPIAYDQLQLDNTFGFFTTSTEVITVPADLVISKRWIAKHPVQYESLVAELIAADKKIQNVAAYH